MEEIVTAQNKTVPQFVKKVYRTAVEVLIQMVRPMRKQMKLYEAMLDVINEMFIYPRDEIEARTMGPIMNNFMEFAFRIKSHIEKIAEETDKGMRSLLYVGIRIELDARINVAKGAIGDLEALLEGYRLGNPVNADGQFENRSDERLIPKAIITKAYNESATNGLQTAENVNHILASLEKTSQTLNEVYMGGSVNKSQIDAETKSFIKHCIAYVHSKRNFYFKIVERPQRELGSTLNAHKKRFEHMLLEFEDLTDIWRHLRKADIDNTAFAHLKVINKTLDNYFDENIGRKIDIASEVTSPETSNAINDIRSVFLEIRTRQRQLELTWHGIMRHLNDFSSDLENDELKEHFQQNNMSRFLEGYENQTMQNIQTILKLDITKEIGDVDKVFATEMSDLVTYMEDYIKRSHINEAVIRSNFLSLDIYYQDLSYEEISQQKAYEIFALLCDIGGSMGLFLGASVMSIFEIVDLICYHTTKRLKMNKMDASTKSDI